MEQLRSLPSVDQVMRQLTDLDGLPRTLITNEVREVLAERRETIKAGVEIGDVSVDDEVRRRLETLLSASLRPVINATGVILHTNLGRAPLPEFHPITRYSNLEYDVEQGTRGKRDVHTGRLLEALIGRPAIVVNNNAAAVYLSLHELAAGKEVIVSRGELIEIGDGFRIPEIMARSGAVLREVGTTNRTRIEDYEQAIAGNTALILRVHPSNFKVSGFTARPELADLARLGRERSIPVYEDLGSGCVIDMAGQGIDEPFVSASIDAGVDLVSFSGDKLLGGPQAGIIAGNAELVRRIRRNPMYRALRVDKLIIQALDQTLRLLLKQEWSRIPTLKMIRADLGELRRRAERVVKQLDGFAWEIREGKSAVGGGSTPDQTLSSWVIELEVPHAATFERRLRIAASVPVIARIERDKIVFDMRTVADEEEADLIAAVTAAAS